MAIVRVSFDAYEEGEQYRARLVEEANRNFQVFLTLLSSYWQSTIDGPNYAREIKSMSLELARIRLALEDVRTDTYYSATRSEFLYQVLSSMLFPGKIGQMGRGKDDPAPDPRLPDRELRQFLLNVLKIYFKGSVPSSMTDAVDLFVNGKIRLTEAFLEARKPGSGFDISDQHAFIIDVILDSPSSTDVILADRNIRILLGIVRPSHTLVRLKYVLEDEWLGQSDPDPNANKPNKILDHLRWSMSTYGYEDFRKFVDGVFGVDPFGFKKPKSVVGEPHSF